MRDSLASVVSVLVAFGLLALVADVAGPRQTFETLARVSAWQATVLVATSFGVSAFTALAWRAILVRYGHRVSGWLLFRLTILAFAAGWIVPSGFVAGIPIAAWFLGRRGVPFSRALASFTISRFLEMTAYVLLLPAVLLSALGSRPLVQAGVLVVLAGAVVISLDLLLGWRLGRRTVARLRRVVPGAADRPLRATADFCAVIAHFFTGPAPRIGLAAGYSFAAIGMAFARAVLTNVYLDLHLTLPEVTMMFAVTVLLMAVPFLPGAIGAYEGGIATVFELLGHSRADGLAYALLVHASELVVVAAGLIVLAHLGVDVFRRVGGVPRRDPHVRRVHGRA
jgi:uncharacterized protein (TIRG00374 family)